MDADKPVPNKLFVHISHNDFLELMEVMLRVEYPCRPSWCPTCSIFGHNIHNCSVLFAAQVKKIKELNEAKKTSTKKDDFVRVQKKGKGKVENQLGNFK